MSKKSELNINGKKIGVSNLDKVFYPRTGFTKGQMIEYYINISKVMLPHLRNRPLSFKRYPDGVEGFFFYEKQAPASKPKSVKTTDVPRSDGTMINYCLINDLEALVWAANLANVEFHTFLHTAPAITRPKALAFDLDPGPPADALDCAQVALLLKGIFDSLGLKSFPKTSGSKGMQVYVPLNTPTTYEKTKLFAYAVAQLLERQAPELVLSKMKKSLRAGKVFVDWSQNDEHKTTVNVYSLRAKEYPTVSTPLTWDEVKKAVKKKDLKLLTFQTSDVLKRVKKVGDLFAPVLVLKQKLPVLPNPSTN
jgi:bifunctional non-homologous end joining protein LigD